MSLLRPTHSQYAHQQLVGTIGEALLYCKERGLTHLSAYLLFLAIISDIGYEVHWYITTGQLPYEEWSEERPWTDEEEW
jgi:hypothetical protein